MDLYELIDQEIAFKLGVTKDFYTEIIESERMLESDREFIIFNALQGDLYEAKRMFNSYKIDNTD